MAGSGLSKGLGAVCAVVTMLALAPGWAHAAPTWLEPGRLSADGAAALSHKVAVNPQGDAIAAWVAGANPKWIAASFRPAGGEFGAPQALSPLDGFVQGVRVAIDPQGNALAVWQEWNGESDVIRAAFRPAGGSFGPSVELSQAENHASMAHVAFDGAGNALVAWTQYNAPGMSGTEARIRAAFRPAGGSFEPSVELSEGGQSAFLPHVAWDGRGVATVAWKRNDGTGNYRVQAASRPPGGSFGTPETISEAGRNAEEPQVASDAQGNTVIVWADTADGGTFLAQSSFRPAGGTFSAPETLTAEGEQGRDPAVALDGQGNALAVWREAVHPSTIQAASRPAGGGFGAPETISGDFADSPVLDFDDAGNAVVVWRGVVDSASRVQSARRPAGGSFAAPVNVGNPDSVPSVPPEFDLDGQGNGVVAWSQHFEGALSVWAAGFDAAGPGLDPVVIPGAAEVGMPASFSASPFDRWSPVLSTQWDFGDGTTAQGAAVSHAFGAPGNFNVTVTSTDAVGNASQASGVVNVPEPPPAADTTAPDLTVSLSRKRFRVAKQPTARVAAKKGTGVRYELSEAADVKFVVQRKRPGRRKKVAGKRRCVKPTRTLVRRGAKRCARWKRAGRLKRAGDAGLNRFRFTGRIGSRKLRPGRYRMRARAVDAAGNRSARQTQKFRIVRR